MNVHVPPGATLAHGDVPVVVASNGGQDRDPAWCLNLRSKPEAEVRIGQEAFPARAEIAGAEERARLWPLLLAYNKPYRDYEGRTERDDVLDRIV